MRKFLVFTPRLEDTSKNVWLESIRVPDDFDPDNRIEDLNFMKRLRDTIHAQFCERYGGNTGICVDLEDR